MIFNFKKEKLNIIRTKLALSLKKIDYEYRHINITKKGGGDQLSENFAKLNPLQYVPVLFIDNTYLTQSVFNEFMHKLNSILRNLMHFSFQL